MFSEELTQSFVQAGAEIIHECWNHYDPEFVDSLYGVDGYPKRAYVYGMADRGAEIFGDNGHPLPVEEIVEKNREEPWNFIARLLESLALEKIVSDMGTLHVRDSFGGLEQESYAGFIIQLDDSSQCYAIRGYLDSWDGIRYYDTDKFPLPVEPRLKVVWKGGPMRSEDVYSKPTEKERAYLEEEMPWLNQEES